MSRSYTYPEWYTTQIQCVRNRWIFEREKFSYYIRHANLKYKYGNRRFWCRGYDVDTSSRDPNDPTVGENTKKYVNISIIR